MVKLPCVAIFESQTGCQALIEGSGAVPCEVDQDTLPMDGGGRPIWPRLTSPQESDGGRKLRLVAGPRLESTVIEQIQGIVDDAVSVAVSDIEKKQAAAVAAIDAAKVID